jgi:cbb3-type cytochrome oxidase maturation protein
MWSMFLLIFLTLCAGFAGWLFFLWAVKSGQYDDVEGPKYRMMDDDEEGQGKTEEKQDCGKE